jgi:chemotaxis protein MotA
VRFWIGVGVVFFCIILGYLVGGGNLKILFQPSEYIIIIGVAVGSFIISNSSKTLRNVRSALKIARDGNPYTQKDYL